MIKFFKFIYKKVSVFYHNLKFYYTVNWTKTLYFNFKKFPFQIAKKLPVFFYGKVKFHDLTGVVIINAPIKMGMIGFGQSFELMKKEQGVSEIYLAGTLVCNGNVHFGKDYLIFIGFNSYCEIGDMFALGSRGKLLCYEKIIFGESVRIGFESQIIDSNFHPILDLKTGKKKPLTSPIKIGNNNWVGNRTSIMQKTITPNNCIVASNSLCNKDYSAFGNNILIGGIPVKLIRTEISRDWEGEKEQLKIWMGV
jgi:acetyltransferase-like isoleucine patch superfamily enzyme